MVMVFPLGSSNLSGVLTSASMLIAHASTKAISKPIKMPAQMASVKNP